jgi:cytochrome c oxidase cbb3-type subunit 3
MSDFTHDFWGFFVAATTLVSIVACGVLLYSQSIKRPPAGSKTELHGHVWDEDLQEYNNPLPRWWMWLFYLTIVFSLGYLVFYPGLGRFAGTGNWTSAKEYEAEMKAADAQYGPLFNQFASIDVATLSKDPKARAMGERLFQNHCAQCHGADAGGAIGFPSLRDKDWLYGGDAATIKASILDGRAGVMPPLGAAVGGEPGIAQLTHYVRSLSGLKHDSALAKEGAGKFAVCAACHGADGKGNPAIGAPNLADGVWLYGSADHAIAETIRNGRSNRMPAQKEFLGEAKVHLLAAYVYGLSGVELAASAAEKK